MQKRLQKGHVGLLSEQQDPSDFEVAAVWLRIPDLRREEGTKRPVGSPPPRLAGWVRRLLHKRWRRSKLAGWRTPAGLILGSAVITVVVASIILSSGGKKQSNSEMTSAPVWNPSAAVVATSGQDSSRGQVDRPAVAERATPAAQMPPSEVATTSPWPRQPPSPQLSPGSEQASEPDYVRLASSLPASDELRMPGGGVPAERNRAPTQSLQATSSPLRPPFQDRQPGAAEYPGYEALSPPGAAAARPPAVAEFEGTIERPPYRARYDNHGSSFY